MFVTGQFCRQDLGTLTEGMDKLQLTGRNLGQVFNFRSGNNNVLKSFIVETLGDPGNTKGEVSLYP